VDLAREVPDFSSQKIAGVLHLAGRAHRSPRSQEEAQEFFRVNADGTRNLLLGLDRSREAPENLVFVSTVAVYGVTGGEGLDEDTPRRATDPYGESKRRAEDLVAEWGRRRGVRIGIVRLPLVAGARAPGNLGAMIRAMGKGYYFGVGDGNARRSMVLARDVAEALFKVAAVGGVFHLTDGRHPSFRELEDGLSHELGRRPPLRIPIGCARAMAVAGDVLGGVLRRQMPFSSRRLAKMTSTLTFSDRRARDTFGWAPKPVLSNLSELVT